MSESIKKYLNSFSRIYFDGEYNTEHGTSILERKARVLNLSQDECREHEKKLLQKYEEFKGLLRDIYDTGSDITGNQQQEIDEFKIDLELNEYEVEELTKAVKAEKTNEKPLINDEGKINYDVWLTLSPEEQQRVVKEVDEKRQYDSEGAFGYETLNISQCRLSLNIPVLRINEKLYYIYKDLALSAKCRFIEELFDSHDVKTYTKERLLSVFKSSFDDFFSKTVSFLVRDFNCQAIRKEDLFGLFKLGELVDITEEYKDLINQVEAAAHYDRLNRNYMRKSSNAFVVGNIQTMLAYGIVSGVGKAFSRIADEHSTLALKSDLSDKVLEYIHSTQERIEEILDDGIIRIFDYISSISDGRIRTFKYISKDEQASISILENMSYLKNEDKSGYIEKLIKVICLNPFFSEAYIELAECLEDSNIQGKKDVLRLGLEKALSDEKKKVMTIKIMLLEIEESRPCFDGIPYYAAEFSKMYNNLPKDIFNGLYCRVNDEDTAKLQAHIDYTNNRYLINLRKEHIITYFYNDKSIWIFTCSGLHISYDDMVLNCLYKDIKNIGYSGIVNDYINIDIINDGEYKVPMISSYFIPHFIKLVDTQRKQWENIINNLDSNDVIKIALELSQDILNSTIYEILTKLDKRDYALLKIRYYDPKQQYENVWLELSNNGVFTDDGLKKLHELKNTLKISDDAAASIEKKHYMEYYELEVKKVKDSMMELHKIADILKELNSRYKVELDKGYEIEKKYFGKPITTSEIRTIQYNDRKYMGQVQDEKENGTGLLIFTNGDRYEGDFVKGEIAGRGIYTYSDGAIFKGEFLNGKRTGNGIHILPDKSEYNGKWKDDYKHGKGVFCFADGRKEEQLWFNGIRLNSDNAEFVKAIYDEYSNLKDKNFNCRLYFVTEIPGDFEEWRQHYVNKLNASENLLFLFICSSGRFALTDKNLYVNNYNPVALTELKGVKSDDECTMQFIPKSKNVSQYTCSVITAIDKELLDFSSKIVTLYNNCLQHKNTCSDRSSMEKPDAEVNEKNKINEHELRTDMKNQLVPNSIEQKIQAAENGDVNAQYEVAEAYAVMKGQKNHPMAFQWYKRAAENGHVEAQCKIAGFYESGIGTKADMVQAIRWYEKAAQQGNAEAQFWLGQMYFGGRKASKDYYAAFKWFKEAAEQGHAEAQLFLGSMYNNGFGINTDYTEAVKWYQTSAEKGQKDAPYFVGSMYENGMGVKKDYKEAAIWYKKAADKGSALGQNALGHMYQDGLGTEKNHKEAAEWYKKAAAQGYKKAQENLETLENKSGCFLTTAMCDILLKSDDCYELTKLREFRDGFLLKTQEGKELVDEYYKIAPSIADALYNLKERNHIAEIMQYEYITNILSRIDDKDYDKAIIKYKQMVYYVKEQVLPN